VTSTAHARRKAGRSFPVVPAAVALVVVLAAIAIAVTATGGGDGEAGADVEQMRPVAIEGAPLPPYDDRAQADPAVGAVAPSIEGRSFDGTPIAVTADGTPKLLVFLAHWCPHCRREVPVIRQWLAERGATLDEIELVAISTGASADLPNWPPSRWLAEEDWPVPTIADDAENRTATAFGITGYPAFVAVDEAGRVAARGSGELAPAQLDGLVASLR
jgi:cytochrome c biogenesis protein CcmG, thiol:disulfide interchange protein DsbE